MFKNINLKLENVKEGFYFDLKQNVLNSNNPSEYKKNINILFKNNIRW